MALRTKEPVFVLGALVLFLFAWGVFDVLTNFEINRCEMTYMFEYPQYIPIPLPERISQNFPKYGLFLYAEGELTGQYTDILKSKKKRLSGIPVLYIPGNAGSYRQARSLGSVLLRMAAKRQNHPHFDVFTVDLIEELAGLYGGFLSRQTQFVHHALRTISQFYPGKNQPKVVLVGHSVGGIIARGLFLNPEFDTATVNTIITLSTPHQPVVLVDSDIEEYYDQTNDYWKRSIDQVLKDVVVISFAGGHRDVLVRSERSDLTELFDGHSRMLSYTTTSLPGVWASTDHLCIVWCKQLVISISKALFSMIDSNTSRIIADPQKRIEIARGYFANPSYTLTRFGDVDHERKDISIRFSEGYNVTLRTKKFEGPSYQYVFLDNLEGEEIFVQSNFWNDKWISVCKTEKCEEAIQVQTKPLRIPWFGGKQGNFVAVLSEIPKGVTAVGSFLSFEIPKKGDVLELSVARIPGRSNVRTLSFWDGFKDASRAHLEKQFYFRIEVNLREVWQALYVEVWSDDKCRGLIRFSVPGFPQDTQTLIDAPTVRSSLKLQSSRSVDHMPLLELILDPKCEYDLAIGVAWQEIFGQIIRFYVVQLPAFLAAVVVVKSVAFFRNDGEMRVWDHLIVHGLVSGFLLVENWLPEDFQSNVEFAVSSPVASVVLWILFYTVSVAFIAVIEFAIKLSVRLYSCPLHYLSAPLIHRLQMYRAKLSGVLPRAFIFPACAVVTTSISYFTCGENGMLFAVVGYFLKTSYLRRNAVLTKGPTDDVRAQSQLLLLGLLTVVINVIPMTVWTKQLPSNVLETWRNSYASLDPDPSFIVSVLVGIALDSSSNSKCVGTLRSSLNRTFDLLGVVVVYGVAAGLLIYAQNALYLINDFLQVLLSFLSVDFLRRAFLSAG